MIRSGAPFHSLSLCHVHQTVLVSCRSRLLDESAGETRPADLSSFLPCFSHSLAHQFDTRLLFFQCCLKQTAVRHGARSIWNRVCWPQVHKGCRLVRACASTREGEVIHLWSNSVRLFIPPRSPCGINAGSQSSLFLLFSFQENTAGDPRHEYAVWIGEKRRRGF